MIVPSQISFGFNPSDVMVVTGAGRGIGRSTAINGAAIGLAVAVWDIEADYAVDTVKVIEAAGGRAVAVGANATDIAQIEAGLAASAELGPLRYLVNNAGPASSLDLGFDEALVISVGSMRKVAAAWLERGHVDDAALVNVASVAGNLIGTAPDWYPAAKAAIMGWTRHMAAYRSDDVRTNAVAPGMTDTRRLEGFKDSEIGQRALGRIPLGRMGTPDEISWAILFLLSPLASYVNGILLTVDGGWTITQ